MKKSEKSAIFLGVLGILGRFFHIVRGGEMWGKPDDIRHNERMVIGKIEIGGEEGKASRARGET